MRYMITLLLICQTSFLPALLSPINQSAKEIQTILERPELALSLGQDEEIEEIIHLKDGYLISTKEREVRVEVVYDEKAHIGARQFTLRFHNTRKK